MNAQKPLFFITREKLVKHVGMYDTGEIIFFMSQEALIHHGYDKDASILKETDDAVYLFSSFLPVTVIESWFNQIVLQRAKICDKHFSHAPKAFQDERNNQSSSSVLLPPRKDTGHREKIKKIQTIHSLSHQKNHEIRRPPRRKKTLSILKEEIHAQKRWDTMIPTCGECLFWKKQYLRFSDCEKGVCTITGNFIDSTKRACSEFQR
jgi:hypothetical protein